jgi:hypothetical protein
MNSGNSHYQTLIAIFEVPPRSDIPWTKILEFVESQGGMHQTYGDRICISIKKRRGIFPRSSNSKCATSDTIEHLQYLLKTLGIEPPG